MGLQVLGVLETRCLDFDDVLLLSVNEGTLPQTPNDNSFIPYMLRKAFGLTTPERRTAVYAYYFYRLVQRARRLRMTFNSSAEGLSSGEMSRFMTQLRVDRNLPIVDLALRVDLDSLLHTPAAVDKPRDLVERLYRRDAEGHVKGAYPSLFAFGHQHVSALPLALLLRICVQLPHAATHSRRRNPAQSARNDLPRGGTSRV